MKLRCSFPVLLLCGSLLAAQGTSGRAASGARRMKEPDETKVTLPAGSARTVRVGEKDVVSVSARIRFTTVLVLPKNEQILDFVCGDKEYWVVSGVQNIAYVKPAKVGSRTNLNLVTASGNIYSFVLTEVSEDPKAEPDLKVFVELTDSTMASAASGEPRFVAARDLESYKRQVALAQEETRRAREGAQAAIDSGISRFVENVRFPYRFEAGRKPFFVRAMYHTDRFTYIQARPEETPTLYEVKDGKPNLVNFQYRNGAYVIDKILDKGYLMIGKAKLSFSREE
jgi:type IV secretory pathway VirB9-like protein